MISLHIPRKYHNRSVFLMLIPLILSSFTHLWNPIGFPAIWVVEGQYMQRAMSVLNGFNLEESKEINPRPYDHPFFGQVLLGGVFSIIGYPIQRYSLQIFHPLNLTTLSKSFILFLGS